MWRHNRSKASTGYIYEEAYFGTIVAIVTGQGGQTSAGNIDAASSADATIATGQGGQTSAGVIPAPYWDVTVATGQGGQSTIAVVQGAELSGATGQGGQSSAGALYQYQRITGDGFWDNKNSYTHLLPALWRVNPRAVNGRRLPSQLAAQNSALDEVAADAFFSTDNFYYTYGDGFGLEAQLSSFKITPTGMSVGAFGTPTIYNSSQYILATGIASAFAAGTAHVYNYNQIASPTGIAAGGFGTAVVTLASAPQTVYPSGIAAGSIGSHTVYNYTQYINLSSLGFTDEAFGTPQIGLLRRVLVPTMIDPGDVGHPTVVNFDRQIYASGTYFGSVGTPFIAYRERFVYPPFIATTWYGTPTIAQREMPQPLGFTDEAFGVPFVHDNRQSINVTNGIFAFQSDSQNVDYNPRHLFAHGFTSTNEHSFPSDRWGIADVYNLTQIIYPYQGEFDEHEEMGRPIWTIVENRNRTTTVIGWDSQKVSHGAFVENTGRPLYPEGWDSWELGAGTFIAYRIRHVYPTDEIVGHFGRWLAVTQPPALLPTGIPPGDFGLAAWSNPPQTIRFTGNFVSDRFGTAYADYAIRTLTVHDGPLSRIGTPGIELAKRYVYPTSMPIPVDPDRNFGSPFVEEHFTIFKPRSILAPETWEGPTVRNVTPQLYTFGKIQTEWGQADIRWNPFPLRPAGWDSAFVERPVIEHRERTIYPTSWREPESTDFNQIRNVDPDPPSNRPLGVEGFADNWTNDTIEGFGNPTVRRNEIHPEGFNDIHWGTPEVRMQGAIVSSMFFFDYGVPTVSGAQYIDVPTLEMRGPGLDPIGQPRMSPYTIFCSFDVPPHYTHEGNVAWEIMDHDLYGQTHPERPVFGTPEASNQFRSIIVPSIDPYTVDGEYRYDGYPDDVFGEQTEVTLKNRIIYPAGLKSFKYGFPMLNFPIEVNLLGNGIDETAVFGEPTIELFNREIHASNWYSYRSGDNSIENFNREIYPSGWDSQRVSFDRGPEPYANTRVHYPEPIIPGMGEQTLWGEGTFIAYKIRHVYPEGYVAFNDSHVLEDFVGTQVRHKPTLNRSILPRGFEVTRFGHPTLTQFDRC